MEIWGYVPRIYVYQSTAISSYLTTYLLNIIICIWFLDKLTVIIDRVFESILLSAVY